MINKKPVRTSYPYAQDKDVIHLFVSSFPLVKPLFHNDFLVGQRL